MEPTMIQLNAEAPYGDAVEKINQRWEDVMESWGHFHSQPDDGYEPHKKNADGYYVGTNQNPDFEADGAGDNNKDSTAEAGDEAAEGEEGGEEEAKADDGKVPAPEKVSVM